MNIPQLKRMLWVMNEIVAATKYGGISRDDLNRKWIKSCKNDYDGKPITERTFFRIISDLKELFECEITCSKISQKYRLIIDEAETNAKEMTLLEILQQKACHSSVNQILQMLVGGNDLPDDDMRAARDIAAAVSRLPQTYAEEFLNYAKHIAGADKAEEDEYYRNYICVWNEGVYHRTWQWLSIGFYEREFGIRIVKSSVFHKGISIRAIRWGRLNIYNEVGYCQRTS